MSINHLEERPTVAVLISRELQHELFAPTVLDQLRSVAIVSSPGMGKLSSEDLPQLLQSAVACITGWDTPSLSEELLASNPQLRLVAHSAGSVHFLKPAMLFAHGIRIAHANAALAEGVAEFTIFQALLCLRRADKYDRLLKEKRSWEQAPGKLLRAQTFGIVSVGSIGREVIARLKPFGCHIIAYDPYLSVAEANRLGVTLTDLETLFATADVVSLHTPLLPATRGMIGAQLLAKLRPGTVFLNTARAGLVDEEALLRELATGRFVAALDVFHEEPLPPDSLLRSLPNVFLTPHIAALTTETLLLQGQMMVEEVIRSLSGKPLQYEVKPEMLSTMA
jgi:phosphoglycerate dehydrogenase-like enzyme